MPNKKKSYQAYYKLTCDVLLQSILHIINERFSIFFIFNNYTSSPSPSIPQNWSEKKPTCKRDGNQYQMSNETSSHKLYQQRFVNLFLISRFYFWREVGGQYDNLLCVFFWRKNATENFQSFLFLTVNSRIHF